MSTVIGILGLSVAWCSASAQAGESIADIPLAVSTERAFPNLEFNRPIVVTHAGDGSDRVFVAEQEGIIKVFKNDQEAEEATVFLDIDERCVYADNRNEEGLLGFAFHPKFKENGEFFLYYTSSEADLLSKISRFRVSKDNPNAADPESEEVILRVPQPYWNHNGGTL
ncbi:MAG: PQQ-dependent sugar dehydrogenase, partial [Planctomycetaceae bacterium]|nr:PQQ-dependent sugar dehydrogenase [Planctomycetaceae bacterium]